MTRAFSFTVIGKPVGKERPRFNRKTGQVYTPKQTVVHERAVLGAWRTAGSVTLDGPVSVTITLAVPRPETHFRKDGELSAAGVRMPYPHAQKPDLDNAQKLVLDSLNGFAWKDDVQVVYMQTGRVWDQHPYTRVAAYEVVGPDGELRWVA